MDRNIRHFLDLDQHSKNELHRILELASQLKGGENSDKYNLTGHHLAMVFEKPSTRTRVSFKVGMEQLGGNVTILDSQSSQLGRGETIADTARVLSRYVQIIMLRTFEHNDLLELARNASVPVINGLTNDSHPCQVMADLMTLREEFGEDISTLKIAWLGDYNNMTRSWVHAAHIFGFELRLACPKHLLPDEDAHNITLHEDPLKAADGADCVTTDTWQSMGLETGGNSVFEKFRVTEEIMQRAARNAIFLHCLPAHRGDEVTTEVMDGSQSRVWDEAENRLHAQKAIILWCLGRL